MKMCTVYKYALVLNEDDIRLMGKILYEDEEFNCFEVADDLDIRVISGFRGQTYSVDDEGKKVDCDAKYYDYDDIFCVFAEKPLLPFSSVYSSIDEMIEEFKAKIEEYLPDDFDYRANLQFIEGVSY